MTNTTDPAGPAAPPPSGGPHGGHGAPGPGHLKGHGLDGFYDALRRPGVVRPTDGRWFAGVATGIAHRLGVDPLVVRAAFILFALFFGAGIGLYLVLWLLMVDDRGRLPIEQALKHGEGGSIFLLVVTALAVLGGGPWDGDMQGMRFGGLVVVGVVAWYFLTRTDPGRQLLADLKARSANGWSAGTPSGTTGASQAASSATSTMSPVPPMSTGNAAANAGTPAASTGAALPPPSFTPSSFAPLATASPKVRTRTIGFAPGLLVLGLSVVTAALVGHFANTHDWRGSHLAVGVAAGLAVLGLGIVGAGVAGRRSGWLAPFAVFGIASSLAFSVVPPGLDRPWQVGERHYSPTALGKDNRYELGFGELALDLSGTSAAANQNAQVTALLGAGELDITIPKNKHVVVNTKARAGELHGVPGSSDGLDRPVQQDGVNLKQTFHYGGKEGDPVALTIDAEIGFGQITILTEDDQ